MAGLGTGHKAQGTRRKHLSNNAWRRSLQKQPGFPCQANTGRIPHASCEPRSCSPQNSTGARRTADAPINDATMACITHHPSPCDMAASGAARGARFLCCACCATRRGPRPWDCSRQASMSRWHVRARAAAGAVRPRAPRTSIWNPRLLFPLEPVCNKLTHSRWTLLVASS